VTIGFGAVAVLVAACGGGAPSPARSTSEKAPAQAVVQSDVSKSSVERALLANGPTTAACQASSSAVRSQAPFGPTRLPLFTCELTITGERASYAVQVLPNGCFVAERRRPGRAVYGCGVNRS
jgi:hypothetical protein